MKKIYLFIVMFISVQFSFSQFFVSSNTEVYVSSNQTLYTNESIDNNGKITLNNDSYLIFDGDFFNNEEIVYQSGVDKGVLQIGSGENTSNQPQNIQFNPDNNEDIPFIILNKLSQTATITRGHARLLESFISTSGTLDAGSYINAPDHPTDPGKVFGLTFANPDVNNVAVIGESVGGQVNNVFVERFIPAGDNDTRAYRLLTSSVNSTGSINENWQENVTSEDLTPNPNPGYGIHITGGLATDGFDQSGSGSPSMFTFDNSNSNGTSSQGDDWSILPDTNLKTLKAGEAYLTFVRGDRSIDITDSSSTPTNTTLRAKGNLLIGQRVFSSSNNSTNPEYGVSDQADFYSLIGNPYQAIVDFRDIALVNVNSNYHWVWDPNVGERGNYVTLDFTNSDPEIVTSNNSNSDANQYIQPGQSFFVQTVANGSASVTFNENDKSTVGDPTVVFSNQSNPSISLLLYTTTAFNTGERESDGLFIKFNTNNNNAVDLMDADKFFGSDENLARLHGNEYLSIENRAMPLENEILPLSTTGYTQDNYTFIVNAVNVDNNFDAYLLDHYTGMQTLLNEGATQVDYTIDTNIPESMSGDRFSIVFDNTTLGVEENVFGSNFSLFPNPTNNGEYSIYTPNLSGKVEIEMTNALGQKVLKKSLLIEGSQININADGLNSGVYIVELSQNENKFTSKLIIR